MKFKNVRLKNILPTALPRVDPVPSFVAIRNSLPYYSFNGIDWQAGTGTAPAQMYSGAYGNGTWVFAGTGNNYFVSQDGINFSTVTGTGGACGNNGRDRIAYNSAIGQFVAIRGTNANMNVYVSANGTSWTQASSIPSGYVDSNLMCTGSSLLVSCYNATGAYDVRILQSDDAVLWNERLTRTVGSTDGSPALAYAGNIAAGFLNVTMNMSVRSTNDGVNWADQAVSFGPLSVEANTNLTGFSPSLNRFVGFRCSNSDRVLYSSDGIAWNSVGSGYHSTSGNTASRIVWSEAAKKFAIITSGQPGLSLSSDGITWTTVSDPFGFNPSALIGR